MFERTTSVKRSRTLGATTLELCKLLREAMVFVIATGFVLEAWFDASPTATAFLHVVENWHIWIALVAYLVISLIMIDALYRNAWYIKVLVRRIVRTFKSLT